MKSLSRLIKKRKQRLALNYYHNKKKKVFIKTIKLKILRAYGCPTFFLTKNSIKTYMKA